MPRPLGSRVDAAAPGMDRPRTNRDASVHPGHKKLCKKIERAGGAEQFHADAKFKDAADAAVAAGGGRSLRSAPFARSEAR